MSDLVGSIWYYSKIILPYLALWIFGGYVTMYVLRWHHPRSFDGVDVTTSILMWPVWATAGIAALIALGIRSITLSLVELLVTYSRKAGLGTINPLELTDLLIARVFRRKVQEDEFGELWQAPNPRETVATVKVKDHTGVHWLRVPPTTATAKAGVAWSYDMRESEYSPEVRV